MKLAVMKTAENKNFITKRAEGARTSADEIKR